MQRLASYCEALCASFTMQPRITDVNDVGRIVDFFFQESRRMDERELEFLPELLFLH